MINKDEVMKVLKGINDPELHRSIVDLNMVKNVHIDGSAVTVDIALTIAGCPLKAKIHDDITRGVMSVSGVEKVAVNFSAMTPEERKQLTEQLTGKKESTTFKGTRPRHIIAIASGKGGVGKSTFAANLAVALAQRGYKVGALDADVYGFSMPRALGIEGQPTVVGDMLIPLVNYGVHLMSMGFFTDDNNPVIWRGPLLHKAINQFITDVHWGMLDFLIIDLPPGTGDVSITISQAIPDAQVLVVTTPQPAAHSVAGRVGKMAEKTNLKVIGVVENMAYYQLPDGSKDYIFGQEGGRDLARRLNVPLMGQVPIETRLREGGDTGRPVVLHPENSAAAKAIFSVADAIIEAVEAARPTSAPVG
jgi:ATP-binding protein involved in chromosome partitioning